MDKAAACGTREHKFNLSFIEMILFAPLRSNLHDQGLPNCGT